MHWLEFVTGRPPLQFNLWHQRVSLRHIYAMTTQFRIIILRKEIHHFHSLTLTLALTSSNQRPRWTARCSKSNAVLRAKAMKSSISRKAALKAILTTVTRVPQARIFRIIARLHFSTSMKLDLPEARSTWLSPKCTTLLTRILPRGTIPVRAPY